MELVVMTLKTYFQLHLMGGIGTVLTGSTVINLKFESKRKSEIGLKSAMFNNWLTFSTSVFSDARKTSMVITTDGASFYGN
jgi:hypothetical protein